jgi:tetratricopeptide (TPR) repeat protein
VLDDLHWADQPSLLLLQFVARELGNSRLLLIGTYRDMELSRQHPLAETLGELTRERLFQRVLLRGLSQQDVGRFIEVAAGVDPPLGLTEAVHTQTEGNPLFVTEVVRLLVQEGELTQESGTRDSWTVRIPEGVREVIGRRLNRLSQRCNETLTIASVVGREFELRQLAPLVEDVSEDRLLDVLEEALSARVIEELPQAVGRYQFTHALIQETLTEELTLTRRVRLHARVAETLEQLYGDQTEAHAAELAHHFAEAEAILGSEKLVQYSLLAGERAQAAYAWEEALSHFERALAAKGVAFEDAGPAMDEEEAALLFGIARAQGATLERHRVPEMAAPLRKAFDHYLEKGDVSHAVEVAEYPIFFMGGQRGGLAELISRALDLVPAGSNTAGRLLARYVKVRGMEEGDYESAQDAVRRALAIAQREGDEGLEMRTLASAIEVDVFHLRDQEALNKSLRAIELGHRVDDPHSEVAAHYFAAWTLMAVGDPARARLHSGPFMTLADGLRDRAWLMNALMTNSKLSQLEGEWQVARDFSDRGLAVSPMDPRLLAFRAMLEYEVGSFSEGESHLRRLLDVLQLITPGPTIPHGLTASVIPVIGRTAVVDAVLAIAEAAAQTVLSSTSATPFVTMQARAGVALLAVSRGDVESGSEQYNVLSAHRSIMSPMGITMDRILGLLAQTMGKLDQSITHFEDALLAWTCCDYADTLLQRK